MERSSVTVAGRDAIASRRMSTRRAIGLLEGVSPLYLTKKSPGCSVRAPVACLCVEERFLLVIPWPGIPLRVELTEPRLSFFQSQACDFTFPAVIICCNGIIAMAMPKPAVTGSI